ncbi:hypothetical protein RB600_006823 [Gaeumannomyces tritici]
MPTVPGNNQQGIFMENGSGGWMSDLEFTGGAIGAYVEKQQFTVRNLKFSNPQKFAVHIHWDWGWAWKDLDISGAPVAVLQASAAITMSLFNIKTTNVLNVVKYDEGATLLAGSAGTTDATAWGVGKRYHTTTGDASRALQDGAAYPRVPKIMGSLLKSPGDQASGIFERSKPQYDDLQYADFINILYAPYSARGDGSTGSTAALNRAFAVAAASNKVLWIPAGGYIVTGTVGLLFTVRSATAGAVLLEWNIHESFPGSAALWDMHIRVGGAKSSELQASDCPKLTGAVNPKWVADHDLEIVAQTRMDIYVARGVLIESTGPVWLYGTASEHCVLYQYQLLDAANVFMGMV